jgi:hypothetical protein
MFSRKPVLELIQRTGLDREMAGRPKGKRSVAVAKKGKGTDRCYGTHRSFCLWDHNGRRKRKN